MNELYPSHAKALRDAKLVMGDFLTLGEVLDKMTSQRTEPKDKKKQDQEPRQEDNQVLCWSEQMLEQTNPCNSQGAER